MTLTPQQKAVLQYVDSYFVLNGYPPSVRQIGAHLGLSSTSTVHAHLMRLVQLGYLVQIPGKRGFVVNRAA